MASPCTPATPVIRTALENRHMAVAYQIASRADYQIIQAMILRRGMFDKDASICDLQADHAYDSRKARESLFRLLGVDHYEN